jgi:hypothetical protein
MLGVQGGRAVAAGREIPLTQEGHGQGRTDRVTPAPLHRPCRHHMAAEWSGHTSLPVVLTRSGARGGALVQREGVAVHAPVYVKSGCPYCEAKRAELTARGVACRELDVGARPESFPSCSS